MMELDKQTAAILAQGAETGAPALYELPVAGARIALREMSFALDAAETPVAKREERAIPGPNGEIPIRIYWPDAAAGALPILLLYHGGGWTLGDMDTHENVCRYYCANAGVIVINVDYRLAPEHKFPAGVDDCYAALEWTAEHATDIGGDASRIAVTGDSAGGNLSAVMCQLAKARGGPRIAFQALTYPSIDLSEEANKKYASRKEFGGGEYFLGRKDFVWLIGLYLEDAALVRDACVSPILAEDLSGLPPALVITAGFDPLHDEGKAYADRLAAAGVPVEYKCFETTIHGFMSFSGAIDAGKEGLALVANRVKAALSV
jgi:acetyl esterase/lipase